jgi:large subunit ribosomal protein L28
MPRECYFTGVRTRTGNSLRYRGKAKYLGGIGRKVTACSGRTFKPNLQVVSTVIDGKPRRIKVSTRAIKMGLITKPVRRKYTYTRMQKQA